MFDDREDVNAGVKFADADLIGISQRVVVSQKSKDLFEIKKRSESDAKLVNEDELLKIL